MEDATIEHVVQVLKEAEGFRAEPYICPGGKLTIGYGHRLYSHGMPTLEWPRGFAESMLRSDIRNAISGAQYNWQFWARHRPELRKTGAVDHMGEARFAALVEMTFQLGRHGQANFKKMWAAILDKDWERAAAECLDSKWARQTPRRAQHVAAQLRSGKLEDYR